jgi:predicted alpha/beta hydrolase family esterase
VSKKALSVYIVCAPFDADLTTEDLVGGFKLKSNLSKIGENCKNLYLMFSDDDDVVPVSHAEKYREKLPEAQILIYKDRKGHFTAPTFPEIINLIKKDDKRG